MEFSLALMNARLRYQCAVVDSASTNLDKRIVFAIQVGKYAILVFEATKHRPLSFGFRL